MSRLPCERHFKKLTSIKYFMKSVLIIKQYNLTSDLNIFNKIDENASVLHMGKI